MYSGFRNRGLGEPPTGSRTHGYHGRVSPLPRWYRRFLQRLFNFTPRPLPPTEEEVEAPGPNPVPPPVTEEEKKVLKVAKIDLLIPENSKAHHTDPYDICDPKGKLHEETGQPLPQVLVVRRGQELEVEVTFDRDYDKDKDDLRLALDLNCDDPRESKGTRVILKINETKDSKTENLPRILKLEGKSLRFVFKFPARCIIGKWKLNLEVHFKSGDKRNKFWKDMGELYVLFNPWCKDDPCFLDDEKLLEEYVLNDTGFLYYGSSSYWNNMHSDRGIRRRPWNYGQFKYNILPNVIKMMEKLESTHLPTSSRNNPVMVARMMAAAVNSNDENGALIGAWPSKEGDFGYGWPDGTIPMAWKGSVKILEEYFKNWEPVKYAQCWVFSGVLTTVCRALGLPTRSLTNFDSAHDTNGSCTIDRYYAYKAEKRAGADSVWNYHVWNEAWMAREDLKDGYGGWQAFDATPQEASQGIWTCGPCPVDGIKHGTVLQQFDAVFVFAEVNADVITWTQDKEGDWSVKKIEKRKVGNKISTKQPNNDDRLDITEEYKFPEGSDEERAAVARAVKYSTSFGYFSEIYDAEDDEDIVAELMDIEELLVGKDAKVKVMLKNKGNEKRAVNLGVTVSSMYYTGVVHDEIQTQSFDVKLSPGGEETVSMTIPVEDYWAKVVDMCYFKVYCIGMEQVSKQTFIHEDKFQLIKPDLTVKAPDSAFASADFQVEVSFTNPLHIPLTKCVFTVESASMDTPTSIKQQPIAPGKIGRVVFTLSADKPGKKTLIASFDSRELSDLSGTAKIEVNQPSGAIRPRSGARR